MKGHPLFGFGRLLRLRGVQLTLTILYLILLCAIVLVMGLPLLSVMTGGAGSPMLLYLFDPIMGPVVGSFILVLIIGGLGGAFNLFLTKNLTRAHKLVIIPLFHPLTYISFVLLLSVLLIILINSFF